MTEVVVFMVPAWRCRLVFDDDSPCARAITSAEKSVEGFFAECIEHLNGIHGIPQELLDDEDDTSGMLAAYGEWATATTIMRALHPL